MNEKEVAEIRRHFNPQKTNITAVRGCCVNEKGEIIAEFHQSLANLTGDETEAVLTLLKKTLSGSIDVNLIDIAFSNAQVLGGEEHKRLLNLRNSSLKDDDAVRSLYNSIIHSFRYEGNYLIMLAKDDYDVFSYTKDGEREEDSSSVYSYVVCGVYPLKLTKPQLSFAAFDNSFKNIAANSVISAPEIGFLFPAFDDRAPNIYNTLFYSKNTSLDRSETVDSLFKAKTPMPAAQQKETFDALLSDALESDCNIEIMQNLQTEINEMITYHKENHIEEPLKISKKDISDILRDSSVSEQSVTAFEKKFDLAFGENAELSPKNIVEVKKFEINTPEVSIKVSPEHSELVQTRIIDGVKYIVIRADGGVEVNGINIDIK